MLERALEKHRQIAAERIAILEQKGFRSDPDTTERLDAVAMRHPDRSVPACYVFDDGTVVFKKLVANQSRDQSIDADDGAAFEAFANRFQPIGLSAMIRNVSNKGLEVFVVFFFCLALPLFAIWLLFRLF